MNPRSQIKEETNDFEYNQANFARSSIGHKDGAQSSFIKVLNVKSISINEMEQLNRNTIVENPMVSRKQRKVSFAQKLPTRVYNLETNKLAQPQQQQRHSNQIKDRFSNAVNFHNEPQFLMQQNSTSMNQFVKRKPGRPRIHPVITNQVKRRRGRPYKNEEAARFYTSETSTSFQFAKQSDLIESPQDNQQVNDSKQNILTAHQEPNEMCHSIFNGSIYPEMRPASQEEPLTHQTPPVLDDGMKKKRGRPRIHPMITTNTIKRGPGRPRIHPVIIDKIPRKRGRPPKSIMTQVFGTHTDFITTHNFDASTSNQTNQNFDVSLSSTNEPTNQEFNASTTLTRLDFTGQSDPIKRKRGRPRKSEEVPSFLIPEIQMGLVSTEKSDTPVLSNLVDVGESSSAIPTNISPNEQESNQLSENVSSNPTSDEVQGCSQAQFPYPLSASNLE